MIALHMALPLHAHVCVSLALYTIPEDTYHLSLEGLPEEKELCDLFAALPQLTRLTCRQKPEYRSDFTSLGLALKQTPHVTALHLNHCKLYDVNLLDILKGCSLELCELHLNHNDLKMSDSPLMTRLGTFTNLQ